MSEAKLPQSLLPCPFCASQAVLKYGFTGFPDVFFIFCSNENCNVMMLGIDRSKDDITKAWNTRVNTQ